MVQPATIMLVDDDAEILSLLSEYLTKANFTIIALPDGDNVIKTIQSTQVDLVVLDVMLPGIDGFALCKMIRNISPVPIIMLSAASEEADKVIGLELGADDYLAKPFSARELLARIKALLRRNNLTTLTPNSNANTDNIRFIHFDNWTLDMLRRELISQSGATDILSGVEFTLLLLFLQHPNQILDRDQISEITRRRTNNPLERGIDVQISRLRNRLQDTDRTLLRTVRNQGYQFCCDVSYEYH